MSDIPLNFVGDSACYSVVLVLLSDIITDVLGGNFGHNVKRSDMSGCPTTFHIHCLFIHGYIAFRFHICVFILLLRHPVTKHGLNLFVGLV